MKSKLTTALLCALAVGAVVAHADESDHWVVKVGVHNVDPKSDNGSLGNGALKTDVGSNVRPTITAEYLFDANWGIEALAALPFEHDVKLNGVQSATTKHLPPTVSVQYHFDSTGSISPFVGVGLNYTGFFSEHTTGPLTGTKLSLSNTWGQRCMVASISALMIAGCLRWMRAGSALSPLPASTASRSALCISIRSCMALRSATASDFCAAAEIRRSAFFEQP